jgi:LuxR family maltose regulon positive regulatory protein
VLARQPADVHELLVQTSVCEQLSPDLATAVSGRADAGALLEELARGNALTVRLTGPQPWFRYHTLLRDYLRADLARRPESERAELHRRVARWAAGHGDLLPALEHAGRSGDRELLVDLVGRGGLRLVLQGNGQALSRLLQLTSAEVRSDPVVALVAAAGALDAEDVAAADDALRLTSPAAAAAADPALAATVALQRAQLLGATTTELDTLAATDAGVSGRRDLDLLAMLVRGLACLKLGRLDEAESDLQRAAEGTREAGLDHLTLQCLLALAAVSAGRDMSRETRARTASALAFAAARGWERSPRCASAYVIAGTAAYQRMDNTAARAHVRVALDLLTETIEPTLNFTAVVLDAVLALDAGEDPPAQYRRVRQAWPADEVRLPPVLTAHAALEQQRMALQLGEPAWTAEVVQLVDQRLGPGGEAKYLRAAQEARRGREPIARRLLADVCRRTTPCTTDRTLIEALVLDAVLTDATGDAAGAHRQLADALAVAEPQNMVRYLTFEGPPVRDLLLRNAGRFGRLDAFAAQVLHAMPGTGPGPVDQLTEREQQILVDLPSLRTAEEIAELQFVSVNTVKTHMHAIYRKLGASNRREALAAARARGLR